MFYPRLNAIVIALVLFGGARVANAEYDITQLRAIEKLMSLGDCGALIGYLKRNPEIMSGSDPLALELRSFFSDAQNGIIACLSSDQVTQNVGRDEPSSRIY